jgi:hypothetical protein
VICTIDATWVVCLLFAANRIAYVDLAGIGLDMMEDDTPWDVIIGDGKYTP